MLKVGQQAPDFNLLNQDKETVRLSDYRGKQVILFAFPKANTPGCNNQACGFRDVFPEIQALNAVVLGISPDSTEDLLAWKQLKNLQYDLLSDPDHKILNEWGAWGKKVLGIIPLPFATRSFWAIDEEGIIEAMEIGVSPGNSVKHALQAIRHETVTE